MSFEMSEGIAALAAAIVQVQRDMPTVNKDRTADLGRGGSYRYADLASCWDVLRPRLTEAGIAVVQSPGPVEGGSMTMTTLLAHSESGQWMRGDQHVPIKPKYMPVPRGQEGEGTWSLTPQECGSAQTYARRYALCAMLGLVADEDDDARGAEPHESRPQQRRPQQQRPQHREEYAAECSQCGAQTTVPFRPTPGGKPILCRDCYRSGAPERQPASQGKGF